MSYKPSWKKEKLPEMGTASSQQEVELSPREMEAFSMQVDEEYNPQSVAGQEQARLEYLQRQRVREAEELRLKYLDPSVLKQQQAVNNCHHESRESYRVQIKPKRQYPVTYEFQELPQADNEKRGIEEDGEGDSLGEILQQKERIRSIITPDVRNNANLVGPKEQIVNNSDGRSPYNGAILNVVSLNHKNQKHDPVFMVPQDNAAAGKDDKGVAGSEASKGSEADQKKSDEVDLMLTPGQYYYQELNSEKDAKSQNEKKAAEEKAAADKKEAAQSNSVQASVESNNEENPDDPLKRRDSWSFEPIEGSGSQPQNDPSSSIPSQNNTTPVVENESPGAVGMAQVEIIPQEPIQVQVSMSSNPQSEVGKTEPKISNCPFAAAFARQAKEGRKNIQEKNNQSNIKMAPVHDEQEQQQMLSAAMNVFSAAPAQQDNIVDKPKQCPFSSPSAAAACPVGGKKPNATSQEVKKDGTIFDEFGGDEKMALFVEDFMEGIMGDSELACYHSKFQDPEEMELLKEKLCSYFKFKLDGSKFYIGKPMPEVHKNLGITHEVFDSACQVFGDRLKKMKPKFRVLKEFIKRIGAIRDEICFPPVEDKNEEAEQGQDEDNVISPIMDDPLFKQLGEEPGVRCIVEDMLEQASLNGFSLFKRSTDCGMPSEKFLTSKYSLFLCSLLDQRYQWFFKDLVESKQIDQLLIAQDDLQTIMDYFRTACVKNDVDKPVVQNLLDFLSLHREDICSKPDILPLQDPLIQSLEQQRKFEMFIELFFSKIGNHPTLKRSGEFDSPECRTELVNRITKILHCQKTSELDMDKSHADQGPINTNDPFFLAAECFRDTLIEVGMQEESAETAYKIFLALRKNNIEETQNKISRIASKMSQKSFNMGRPEEQKDLLKICSQGSGSNSFSFYGEKQDGGVSRIEKPSFESNDQESRSSNFSQQVKYDMKEMFPRNTDTSNVSDDGIITSKKGKEKLQETVSENNAIIMEGMISKFNGNNQSLVKRYVVLNQFGLFIYKDDLTFRSTPQRPIKVLPLQEIAGVNQREYDAKDMIRGTTFGENEVLYVMEIALKQAYGKVVNSIQNYAIPSSDGKTGKKIRQKPQHKQVEDEEMGFIFADVHRKQISRWVRRVQTELKRVQNAAAAQNVSQVMVTPDIFSNVVSKDSARDQHEQPDNAAF